MYLDGSMVRVLGAIDEPDSEAEKDDLRSRGQDYWDAFHDEHTEPVREDLRKRLGAVDLSQARFIRLEAAAAHRLGLAAELYPELFTPSRNHVDKDGLVDYRELSKRMKQIQPGVFHDSTRNLLLFAHRFFRRSLSHRNSLNTHFLRAFDSVALDGKELQVRLKLDPDLVGYPESAKHIIELEHWRGPLFNDDISSIPSGVAEHKANERTRFYEGVDRTQVWWKSPEVRQLEDDSIATYRTFEVEELIENPSGGLSEHQFGCRYAHAEYSKEKEAVTHFDGAIRSYLGDVYLDRIEASIDRAGKHAEYTKLFRFDGELMIRAWKRLLGDFFRGNPLIPEYLGALPSTNEMLEAPLEAEAPHIELAALISLTQGSIAGPVNLAVDHYQQIGDQVLPYLEIGRGDVAQYLRSRFDPKGIILASFGDKVLNVPRIVFAETDSLRTSFESEIAALGGALSRDIADDHFEQLSISFAWENDGIVTALSIAGEAKNVVRLLNQLGQTIDPTRPPSEWIEALSARIKDISCPSSTGVSWSGVDQGLLLIMRDEWVRVEMDIPTTLGDTLGLTSEPGET
ncbi:hypothetical protein CO669_31755 [Bradyrhizobium sp. Y36]|nr:hypothetical protein CO669_31755 [Bradyrhizobium sp. Y36]